MSKLARAIPVAAIAALSLGASASPATAQETAAATCSQPDKVPAFFAANGSARIAQTFSPSLSGPLTRAEFYVTKAGTPGDYVVQLMALDGNVTPNNTVLASTTVLDSTQPDGNSTLSAVFGTPTTVAAGESYGLVVTRPGSNILQMGARKDCAGVMYFSYEGTTTWVAQQSDDLIFTAYVTPPGADGGGAAASLSCKGNRPSIVGTAAPDQIAGTAAADVIDAQGGNDTVTALGGNDVVCGGPGKDKLNGGKGKDTLLGQKGKDTLKGGGGKDFCKGGKGKDTASKCEVEKSI